MNTFGQLYKIEFVCKDTQTGKRIEVVDYLTSPTPPTVEGEIDFQNQFGERGRFTDFSHFRVVPVEHIPM